MGLPFKWGGAVGGVQVEFGVLLLFFLRFIHFQVTWIRHRDLHLLTVDKTTYTSDQRFLSANNPQIGDWSLQVNINIIKCI